MKIFQNQLEFKRESGSFTAILCGVTGNLETLDAEMGNYLSKNEIEVAMKFGGKKRRLTYLLGRFAAKEALSSLLGSASKTDIEVEAGIFGQPVVVYDGKKQIAVNIAHTDECAVAVAYPVEHPLGIDLEDINPKNTTSIENELTKSELEIYKQVFEEDKAFGATIFWTAKEAMSKCIKTGLMTPLAVFELAEMQKVEDAYISTFTNFAQYKAQSYRLNSSILTLVMPQRSAFKNTSSNALNF